MPHNLFAACRIDEDLVAKRVPLDATVQGQVEEIFCQQEDQFRTNCTEEIIFNGSWKPEKNEFLTIDLPQEAMIFEEAIDSNAISFEDINTENFADEGIKALFMGFSENGTTKILVQSFDTRQMLSKKLMLGLRNNSFRRISDFAFTLNNLLTCIIEDGKIKFKSFHKLRAIINMSEIYREATDQEVSVFASHANLDISDIDAFITVTDQQCRTLIHAIASDDILDNHTPAAIDAAAQATGLTVKVRNGKIIMPPERREIKDFLQFLNESRYSGPLSGQTYITNSRKRV